MNRVIEFRLLQGIYRQSGSEARFKMLSEKMLATDGDDCDEIFSETDIYTIARYTKNLLMNVSFVRHVVNFYANRMFVFTFFEATV